jgi:putative DNA primase/helicase
VNSLPFAYDPEAPTPERWFQFLHEVWPEDKQCRRTLAEIMGLLLTGDTKFQKAFMIVGPKRSGKGTIGQVMDELYGHDNVAHPGSSLLNTQFGMAPLIDKPVAIISDARVDKASSTALAERLLSVSGEDQQTIDVKYEKHWTGRLNTRFVLMSNELPRINDASGALASRFVVLTMTESFLGREDLGLMGKLLTELPGILNWALNGLARLRTRGRFEMPQSSLEQIQVLEDLSSPVKAFLRERCVVGPTETVRVKSLYGAWRDWCEAEGHTASSNIAFGRSLRGVVTGIALQGMGQAKKYRGVGLKPE